MLFADGTDPAIDNSLKQNANTDLNNDRIRDLRYSATKANITTIFNELAGKLGSQDILYIFTTAGEAVTIVWKAKTVADARPVNVAARLYPSGAVRLYYGAGNQHTSRLAQRDKTIGVAAGTAASMLLGLRNGLPDLGSASSLLIQPATLPPPSTGLPWEGLLLQ